jgi:hypothetical protein
VDVIMVGPFSREIQSLHLFDPAFFRLPKETDIKVIWVDLDVQVAKARIIKRNDPRDQWKIEHWQEYQKRRIEPPQHHQLFRFENSVFNLTTFDVLLTQIAA